MKEPTTSQENKYDANKEQKFRTLSFKSMHKDQYDFCRKKIDDFKLKMLREEGQVVSDNRCLELILADKEI
jgi:hypothetical protein